MEKTSPDPEDALNAAWRKLLVKPGCLLLILQLLEQPHRTFPDLVKTARLSTTGAEYHLRAMERTGLVRVEKLPEHRIVHLTNRRLTALLLDELVTDWSSQPVVGGRLWTYLQERVQKHRERDPTLWFKRPSLRRLH